MNAILAWFKAAWLKLKGNPIFVTAYSLFGGALGKLFWTAYQTGTFNWSLKSIQSMAAAAAFTTVVALVHLYTPVPEQNDAPPNPPK